MLTAASVVSVFTEVNATLKQAHAFVSPVGRAPVVLKPAPTEHTVSTVLKNVHV